MNTNNFSLNYDIILHILNSYYSIIYRKGKYYYYERTTRNIVASRDDNNIYLYVNPMIKDNDFSATNVNKNKYKAIITFSKNYQIDGSSKDVMIIDDMVEKDLDAKVSDNSTYDLIDGKVINELSKKFSLYNTNAEYDFISSGESEIQVNFLYYYLLNIKNYIKINNGSRYLINVDSLDITRQAPELNDLINIRNQIEKIANDYYNRIEEIPSALETANISMFDFFISLRLDDEKESSIKERMFPDDKVFESIKLLDRNFDSIINSLNVDNEIDSRIKEKLFSKDVLKKYLTGFIPMVTTLDTLISRLDTDNKTDCRIKESLFFDKEKFEVLGKYLNSLDWVGIINILDVNNEVDRKIKESLFTDEEKLSTISSTLKNEDWLSVFGNLKLDNETDKKIKKIIRNQVSRISLTEEEKKLYLSNNYLLYKLLKNNLEGRNELLLINLDSNNELDAKLKKKILTDKKFLTYILPNINKTHAINYGFFILLKCLDLNNKNDIEIKRSLLLDNFSEIYTNTNYNIKTILSSLDSSKEVDIEIKKKLLLEKKYKDIIIENEKLNPYLELDSKNEIDAEIKRSIFLENNELSVDIRDFNFNNIHGLTWVLERLDNSNPLDLEIKRKIFYNEEALISKFLSLNNPTLELEIRKLFNRLNTGETTDERIKRTLFTNQETISNTLKFLDFTETRDFFALLRAPSETNSLIKRKILLNNDILKRIKAKEEIQVSFVRGSNGSIKVGSIFELFMNKPNEDDLNILKEILLDEEKCKIVLEKNILSLLNLLNSLNNKSDFIDSINPFVRNIFFNEEYISYFTNESTVPIITTLIDLNKQKDVNMLEEILLAQKNKSLLDLCGMYLITRVLNMANKDNKLYKKIEEKILNDDEEIMSLITKMNISNLINSFDNTLLENKAEIHLLIKIFSDDAFKETIKNSPVEQKKMFYEFVKKIIAKAKNNKKLEILIDSIEKIIIDPKMEKYIEKKVKEALWSPESDKQIYKFIRGTFVIAPNGDQITANLDTLKPEIIIDGKQVENHYLWEHHFESIRESLRIFGQPAKELSTLDNHPFPCSVYGRDKGYLVIMLEGQKIAIYFPDTTTIEQLDKLQELLSSIEEYEKINQDKMEFSLLISDNIIEETGFRPIYKEDIKDILAQEGIKIPSFRSN